jgi:hypothetical protein
MVGVDVVLNELKRLIISLTLFVSVEICDDILGSPT